ncbi:helix-turn-helix domain-containing protein [Niabella beijingensis]|uniref:helix-turn-helix domain-containing protein n=1 Tax=Niabella beijingensis TaxID=2872700 RepID=UPI001CBB7BD1|nr:AraC family transcriptional regulator [Niabella beijingensis]MBZ4191301.1 AraC family transcriptional regulator [Niabella beijingensis]
MRTKQTTVKRGDEITERYFRLLDEHLQQVINGDAPAMLQLSEIAALLFVSHRHLTDTVQKTTGNHPCHFYDLKIVEQAQKMLRETELSVAAIALKLTYDPSNFSKFFRKFTGMTPGAYRGQHQDKKPKSSP